MQELGHSFAIDLLLAFEENIYLIIYRVCGEIYIYKV
jgi:hypothetical protein